MSRWGAIWGRWRRRLIVDEDVEGLLSSGLSEDALFELTLAAALRQCVESYERGTKDLS